MAKNFLTSIFGSRNDRLLKQYRRNVGPLSQGAVLVQAQEPVPPG